MKQTIEAKEQELKRIFSDDYLFEIPAYQRPYAWTTEQTSELLDDLMTAKDGMASWLIASKKTLNAKNLEAMGAARLAELLLELSSGDAAAKWRLRLELPGSQSAGEVAREVRKRLTSIARTRSSVDRQTRTARPEKRVLEPGLLTAPPDPLVRLPSDGHVCSSGTAWVAS